MKTEKTILVKFCGSAVLFLAGAYFLPMWTAWGDMRQYGGGRRLLTGAPDRDFYGGVCGGVFGTGLA